MSIECRDSNTRAPEERNVYSRAIEPFFQAPEGRHVIVV